ILESLQDHLRGVDCPGRHCRGGSEVDPELVRARPAVVVLPQVRPISTGLERPVSTCPILRNPRRFPPTWSPASPRVSLASALDRTRTSVRDPAHAPPDSGRDHPTTRRPLS